MAHILSDLVKSQVGIKSNFQLRMFIKKKISFFFLKNILFWARLPPNNPKSKFRYCAWHLYVKIRAKDQELSLHIKKEEKKEIDKLSAKSSSRQ